MSIVTPQMSIVTPQMSTLATAAQTGDMVVSSDKPIVCPKENNRTDREEQQNQKVTPMTYIFWILLYRRELKVTLVSYGMSQVKFDQLWPRWILSTSRHPDTLWPIHSVVSRADIEYAVANKILHPGFAVNTILDACRVIHQRFTQRRHPRHFNLHMRRPKLMTSLQLHPLQQQHIQCLQWAYERETCQQFPQEIMNPILQFYGMLGNQLIHAAVPKLAIECLPAEMFDCLTDPPPKAADSLSVRRPAPVLVSRPRVVELFGCPFYGTRYYCSPLVAERKYLGSLGDAFGYIDKALTDPSIMHQTCLHVYPPFDVSLIDSICLKLEELLRQCAVKQIYLDIVILLPTWDKALQKEIGASSRKDNTSSLLGFELLRYSRFRQRVTVLDRQKFLLYNSFTDSFAPSPPLVTIVLSSRTDPRGLESLQTRFLHYLDLWERLAQLGKKKRVKESKE